MKLTARQIADSCAGTLVVPSADPEALATGVCWDSRVVAPGDVYIALPGERVDGHRFIASAIEKGAVCAMVTRELDPETLDVVKAAGAAVVQVADAALAIVDLARAWRGALDGLVLGVTGSSGKTTTKNFIRDVLGAAGSVVATKGNQNNELGVPRTVLSADADTDAVVVEMGMQGLGELDYLCEFVRPQWGVIVNVGEAHIELLGSRENIGRAKAELLSGLCDGGMAFVNADDDFAEFVCDVAELKARGVRVSAYSATDAAKTFSRCADVADGGVRAWATDVVMDAAGCPTFTLHLMKNGETAEETATCTLALRGMHNVGNACAAAAVGAARGMAMETIVAALGACQPESGRQEIVVGKGGYTLINDAYNANPESMRASLRAFAAMGCAGKRYAVLGDMGELGSFAPEAHASVGRLAATLPIDCCICVGELAAGIADAAVEAGANPACFLKVANIDEVLAELDIRLAPEDCVLVKASHFMGLSRIVEGLKA